MPPSLQFGPRCAVILRPFYSLLTRMSNSGSIRSYRFCEQIWRRVAGNGNSGKPTWLTYFVGCYWRFENWIGVQVAFVNDSEFSKYGQLLSDLRVYSNTGAYVSDLNIRLHVLSCKESGRVMIKGWKKNWRRRRIYEDSVFRVKKQEPAMKRWCLQLAWTFLSDESVLKWWRVNDACCTIFLPLFTNLLASILQQHRWAPGGSGN